MDKVWEENERDRDCVTTLLLLNHDGDHGHLKMLKYFEVRYRQHRIQRKSRETHRKTETQREREQDINHKALPPGMRREERNLHAINKNERERV